MDVLDFLNLDFLYYLFVGFPIGLFLFAADRRRRELLAQLGAKLSWDSAFAAGSALAILAVLVASISRPYWGYEKIEIDAQSRDIVAIADISRSMLAADAAPSRLFYMRRKLRDLVDLLETKTPGDRLGIVLFSGEAYLYCPLTQDYEILRVFIDEITPALIRTQGSAIQDAVTYAVRSLQETHATNPRLLLLSDGEDDELNVQRVVAAVKAAWFQLDVIGIGTDAGAPIEIGRNQYLRDETGEMVITKLNAASLKKLARGTGGRYFSGRFDDSDLQELFAPVVLAAGTDSGARRQSFTVYHEFGPLLLWFPLVLISAALIFGKRGIIFALVIVALPRQALAGGDKEPPPALHGSAYDAYQAYRNGRYQEARELFLKEHERRPNDEKIQRGLASSLFKTGDTQGAARHFSDLMRNADSGRERFEALYNLGNTFLQGKDLQKAIESYEEALKILPEDPKTTFNLELARKLLEQQQQQEQQQEQDQSQENDQQKQENNQDKGEKEKPGQQQKKDKGEEQEQEQGNKQDQKSDQGDQKQEQENQGGQEGGDKQNQEQQGQDQQGREEQNKEQGEQNEEQQENGQDPKQDNNEQQGRTAAQQFDEQALGKSEARAWLDSLPDSPVLLRQRPGDGKHRKQAW